MNALSIFALLTVVLFKFQNCAPAPIGAQVESDSEVRLIDQWYEGKLEFLSPAYVVQAPVENVVVQGLCVGAESGELLSWRLVDQAQRRVLEEGQSECIRGGFQLQISQLIFQDCASRFELVASRSKDNRNAVTVLRPFCGG